MGQFFVWKIFLGILSLLFLPIGFFHTGESVSPAPVSRAEPESITVATTTTAREQIPRPKSPPQVVKPKVTQTIVATTTKPLPFKQTVSTPGALVVATAAATSSTIVPTKVETLDGDAIIALTNVERVQVGLAPLVHSSTLSAEADAKALDMIAQQYFEHVAPDGTDIAALAEKYGYDFLHIGENLALGTFHSSPDVMTGWMNSPGHRANILNTAFTEIGVAAVEGNWKGERVWFAVQEFGRPASACPAPDALLKDRIATAQSALVSLDAALKSLQADIDAASAGDQTTLLQKTNDYNAIVNSYNSLVASTKTNIAAYNSEVQAFNVCAGF